MEDERTPPKDYPSLPSNYVSILQLQERWLKKKESDHKEKEEDDPTEHEEMRQHRMIHRKADGQNGERMRFQSRLVGRRPRMSGNTRRAIGLTWSESKPEARKADGVVVDEQTGGTSKNKNKEGKKRIWYRNRKPRVEENQTGDAVAGKETIPVEEIKGECSGQKEDSSWSPARSEAGGIQRPEDVRGVEMEMKKAEKEGEIFVPAVEATDEGKGFRRDYSRNGKHDIKKTGVLGRVGDMEELVNGKVQQNQGVKIEEDGLLGANERNGRKGKIVRRSYGKKDGRTFSWQRRTNVEKQLESLSMDDREDGNVTSGRGVNPNQGRCRTGINRNHWRYGTHEVSRFRGTSKQSDSRKIWVKKGENAVAQEC